MSGHGRLWFAIRVRANYEQAVCAVLENKGLESFLPTYKEPRTWSDRTKIIHRPLFPGYLFCRTSLEDRLPILTTPGVKDIVGFGRAPAPIPDGEIHAIRTFLDYDLQVRPWPFLRVGQSVTIQKGPLSGVEAVVEEFKGNYRVIVSVSLLQRSIAAEVDGSWLRSRAA